MATNYEYRLNRLYPNKQMPVPFVPDIMFIINISNANLYLNVGSIRLPTHNTYDVFMPRNSYGVFKPYKDAQEFGALLEVANGDPIEWDCWVMFRLGEAPQDWNIHPNFDAVELLTPMPSSVVSASFTFVVNP